jgi:type IV pilus assembly protein PilB
MYDDIKSMIDAHQTIDKVKAIALEHGMTTLRDSCKKLVLEGVTTIDELLRMTYSLE